MLLVAGACHPALRIAGKPAANPLEMALASYAASFDSILKHPEIYEVQILYTQIDRDADQTPHFHTYAWQVDSNKYFYPASMVKMPLALLSLEKIRHLQQTSTPGLRRETPYALDSLKAFQQPYSKEPAAPNGKPSIAHDIRGIFTTSNNLAYNHMFEFLGRAYINETLQKKGYTHTGILHRFNYPGRDNRYSSPMVFYLPNGNTYRQPESMDPNLYINPQTGLRKGIGYLDLHDSLVHQPFDFSKKNWFALTDMEKMLRAILFPNAVPAANRFDIAPEDYPFVYHYMGIFPRESDYPAYDTAQFHDGYVKFFLFGDTKARQSGKVRSFNKVGEAYGTLTDVSYIIDTEKHVEFILAATILCNRDGIFNDERYDYDKMGFPFLSKLGQAVYQYECKRKRAVLPDLATMTKALKWKDPSYK